MSKPFPPGSPAHLKWGVRAWKVLAKCGPLRRQWRPTQSKLNSSAICWGVDAWGSCWLSSPELFVSGKVRVLFLSLKKGPKAFRLPREIWVKWAELNLTALTYTSLGLCTQFAVLLLLMVCRRFLQLWASSLLFPQRKAGRFFPWTFWLG